MSCMVELTFGLTGYRRLDQETKAFVAYCPSLDIYTSVQTRDEVEPAMRSAVEMFIRVCYDRGILERVLQQRGFSMRRSASQDATPPVSADYISVKEAPGDFEAFPFNVPMPLVSDQLEAGMGAV